MLRAYWTEEKLKHARKLKSIGFSMADIAKAMGKTRNAVIGALWRFERYFA